MLFHHFSSSGVSFKFSWVLLRTVRATFCHGSFMRHDCWGAVLKTVCLKPENDCEFFDLVQWTVVTLQCYTTIATLGFAESKFLTNVSCVSKCLRWNEKGRCKVKEFQAEFVTSMSPLSTVFDKSEDGLPEARQISWHCAVAWSRFGFILLTLKLSLTS